MNFNPLVSVVIPSYNHEAYVEATINSILLQDYPRIELVIVDDASKDDTWNKVLSLRPRCEQKLERVVLERNESNRGTCFTLNKLMSLAKGDFILSIASDDILLSGAISALLMPMIYDEAIGVVVGQNRIMDESGKVCFWDGKRKNIYDKNAAVYKTFNDFIYSYSGVNQFGKSYGRYEELVKHNHIANGFLVRRKVLDCILPFVSEAPLEDWWWHWQMSKITCYKSIDTPTFCYRWHAMNSIKNRDLMLRLVRQTLWYEWKSLLKSGNRYYIEVFSRVHFKRKYEWGLGRFLYFERVRGIDKKWHEFHIGKWSLKFRERGI